MSRVPIVLGIAGSPRRHGNSDRLLDAALEGARESGAEVRRLVAAETGLHQCLGCNACSIDGVCIQRDSGADVYAAIDEADAIIVASPVFFAGVPGVLKVLVDRMQPYWARTHVLGLPAPARRPGALLLVRGGGDPYGFDSAEATIRSVFAVLGIDILGAVRATGADAATDLADRPDTLAEARNLGAVVALEAAHRLSGH